MDERHRSPTFLHKKHKKPQKKNFVTRVSFPNSRSIMLVLKQTLEGKKRKNNILLTIIFSEGIRFEQQEINFML